jgi:hypothetical protein
MNMASKYHMDGPAFVEIILFEQTEVEYLEVI